MNDSAALYTIGYAGYRDGGVVEFLRDIKKHGLDALVDVRSNPYSQFYANFNRDSLAAFLKKNGVAYLNFADEFGARQVDERYFSDGRLDFEKFARSEKFLEGVARIERGLAQKRRIVLMCAEKAPETCHRAILVAREFHARGARVSHIVPGEDHPRDQEDVERFLLNKFFPGYEPPGQNGGQTLLFGDSPEEATAMIKEAYRRMSGKIAFTSDAGEDEQTG